jgi:hypothetical protein
VRVAAASLEPDVCRTHRRIAAGDLPIRKVAAGALGVTVAASFSGGSIFAASRMTGRWYCSALPAIFFLRQNPAPTQARSEVIAMRLCRQVYTCRSARASPEGSRYRIRIPVAPEVATGALVHRFAAEVQKHHSRACASRRLPCILLLQHSIQRDTRPQIRVDLVQDACSAPPA